MYKLLLVTDQESIRALFENQIDWASLDCRKPQIAATAEEAIALLNSSPVDAVGYYLSKPAAVPLIRYLRYGRPSLPIFEVCDQPEKQLPVLRETRALLDRLHADFSDEYYDEDAMLTILRDELAHQMLAGEIKEWPALERSLKLIRARLDMQAPCVIYEMDMPQGEVYLSEHQHAQERLESALRNNFFGRYVDGIYYAVAVLTPRHIRLMCIPMQSDTPEDPAAFAARADEHIHDSLQQIKEYLDLDMTVVHSAWLQTGLRELIQG